MNELLAIDSNSSTKNL